MLDNLITVKPSILTIITTHSCTASCNDCCFACHPNKTENLTFKDIKEIIDQSLDSFPDINLIVFSGGECFLLYKDLLKSIEYCHSRNLKSRIVTNGFWATSPEITHHKLLALKQAGLNEIDMSTGDNHQRYVPVSNILQITKSASEIGFDSIVISVEGRPNANFTVEKFIQQLNFSKSEIENAHIEIISGAWMSFNKHDEYPDHNSDNCKCFMSVDLEQPCRNIFSSITVSPHKQLLSCCGLTVECNPYLKLGNIDKYSLSQLYYNQHSDLYKLWLFTHGPKYIYEKICAARGITPSSFSHPCAYCIENVNDPNLKVLKSLIHDELPNIILEIELINKSIL